MKAWVIAVLPLALAACDRQPQKANNEAPADAPIAEVPAGADLRTATGDPRGRATATQAGEAIQVRLDATGMPPGIYGVHIHNVGRCDPPSFESAGDHWNPTNRLHGTQNPGGAHKGDLPNLTVAENGTGRIDFAIEGARVRADALGMIDDNGAAIVVHAQPDDNRTDPSGNSGDRIACGAFG